MFNSVVDHPNHPSPARRRRRGRARKTRREKERRRGKGKGKERRRGRGKEKERGKERGRRIRERRDHCPALKVRKLRDTVNRGLGRGTGRTIKKKSTGRSRRGWLWPEC